MSSFLTPDATYDAWLDSAPMRKHWATVILERGGGTVTGWWVLLAENETEDVYLLDHARFVATMQRIVRDRDTIGLAPSIVDAIEEVVNASSEDWASDAMCQLDCVGFDAIVQLATLGTVTYG